MYFNQILWLWMIFSQVLLSKLIAGSEDAAESELIVHTLTGTIEGISIKSLTDEDVVAFYGIPYAEPPIGDLRFKPPVPIKPWTGVLKATKKPLPCYQQYSPSFLEYSRKTKTVISRPWSEDCLTLNVWIPQPIPDEPDVNIPILVFLHGGGFQTGSNLLPHSDGSTFAAHGGVFTISINYRLGPFGFLSFGHPDAPGNVGLMDQQVAVRWVKENIPKFGGQTGNIILWGSGAGGASVGFQIISPGNAGVFTSASVRSGSPTCSWAFEGQEVAHNRAETLAVKLGCKKEDLAEEIECLRNRDPEDILDAAIADYHEVDDLFKPTVDGNFLTEPPIDALRSGNFNNVSTLATTNAEGGSSYLLFLNPKVMANATEAGMSARGFREVANQLVPNLSDTEFELMKDFYVDKCDPEDPSKLLDSAVRLYSDVLFDCCMETFADYLSQKSIVVRLVYDQLLEKNPSWMGTTHATDQLFFNGYPVLGEKGGYTEDESTKSKELIKIASYFAKKKFSHLQVIATMYNIKSRAYIRWSTNTYTAKNYRHKECSLWNDLIPKLQRAKNTCSPV